MALALAVAAGAAGAFVVVAGRSAPDGGLLAPSTGTTAALPPPAPTPLPGPPGGAEVPTGPLTVRATTEPVTPKAPPQVQGPKGAAAGKRGAGGPRPAKLEMAVRGIEGLEKGLVSSDAVRIRNELEQLVALGAAAIPDIREALETSQNRYLRLQLIQALARIGGPGSVEPLRDLALDGSDDLDVRQNAVRALGEMAAENAVPALLDLYQAGRGRDRGVWQQVRSESLQALARQGGDRAYDTLSRALAEEEDPFVRRWAAAGLGSPKFHDRESLGLLDQALRSDTDENTRHWAANSLGDLPDRRAGRVLEDILGRFPPERQTRKIVMFALAKRKDASLAPAIRADLERESDSEMVRYAASKLVEVLDVEALPDLEAARARHATNPELASFFDGWIPALRRKALGQQEQPDIKPPR